MKNLKLMIKYIFKWFKKYWYSFLGALLVSNIFTIYVIKNQLKPFGIPSPYRSLISDLWGLFFIISVLLVLLTILYKIIQLSVFITKKIYIKIKE